MSVFEFRQYIESIIPAWAIFVVLCAAAGIIYTFHLMSDSGR